MLLEVGTEQELIIEILLKQKPCFWNLAEALSKYIGSLANANFTTARKSFIEAGLIEAWVKELALTEIYSTNYSSANL